MRPGSCLLVLLALGLLLPSPSDAARLRGTILDRQFPDGWCPIESRDGSGGETLWPTFTAVSPVVRLVLTVDNFSPGEFGEWMNNRFDNLSIVERATYAANRAGVPGYEDCYVTDSDAPAFRYDPAALPSGVVYLESFDTDPTGDSAREWSAGGFVAGSGFSGTAPRNTLNGGDTTGGAWVLGVENDGAVALAMELEITGLTVGVEYVVVGWWSANVELGQLLIEVFDDSAVDAPITRGVGSAITEVFPNPANPAVTIRLRLDRDDVDGDLVVHDLAGRVVRRFATKGFAAGQQAIVWDGTDDAGRPVASGVYAVAFEVDGVAVDRAKVTLVR